MFCLMLGIGVVGIAACEPDVGTEAWCEQMADTPRGDWSANQVADYAQHCLFD